MVTHLSKRNSPPHGNTTYVPGIANVEKVLPAGKPVVGTVTVPVTGKLPAWPIVFGWACAGAGTKNWIKVSAPAKIVSVRSERRTHQHRR